MGAQFSKENGGYTVRCCQDKTERTAPMVAYSEPETPPAPPRQVEMKRTEDKEKQPAESSRRASDIVSDKAIEEASTWDSLADMATTLWSAATSFLTGEEKETFIENERKSIQRMDTTQLRSHVKAAKDQVNAQLAVMETENVSGEFVAQAQRESLQVMSGKLVFDGDTFANITAASLDEATGKVNASKFLEAANCVPLLMGGLGRTFEFASGDLLKKLDTADKRMKETATALGISVKEVTLQQMVELDIKNGTTHAGKKKAPASRTILRLMWFFDFVGELLKNLARNPEKKLTEVCSETYEKTLAPNHAWPIRAAARSGMNLLPPKVVFRKRLGTEGLSESEECAKLDLWSTKCLKTTQVMWDYMSSKNLRELP